MEPPDETRLKDSSKDVPQQNTEVDESWDEPSQEEETLYSTSPPRTPRQMKRMSNKHQRNSQGSKGKEKLCSSSPLSQREREGARSVEPSEEHSYKQEKKQRFNQRSNQRDSKKTFEGSFMLDPMSKTSAIGSRNMDPRKPYLSLGMLPVRTHRQTSRTDCPADRLKFFETLRLLLKLTSMSSKKKEKEQRGLENTAFMDQNNEVIWLELQAWHARRSVVEQDLYLYTARQAIPDIIKEVLHFKVDYSSLAGLESSVSVEESNSCPGETNCRNDSFSFSTCSTSWGEIDAAAPFSSVLECREHLQRQRVAFDQVKRVMSLLESVEALYPSLQTLQKDYEKYAARDFQGRVQALCLWLNITQDLNQKLRVMGTVLGLRDLSRIGWPIFEIPSPRCSHGNEDDEVDEDETESTATFTADNDGEERTLSEATSDGEQSPCPTPKFSRLLSEEELLPRDNETCYFPTAIYRPFVDKALKQMGLRKLILRLHKLMDRSLQRSRTALLSHMPAQELSAVPGYSLQHCDYLPELSRHVSGQVEEEAESGRVSWKELVDMDLPSFQPAFLVLCRVLLNVIHECLKLRLEQRPAGEPSLLSIKQLVRECKEVLKGGLLMKQYYQFMLQGVVTDPQGLQTNANIDEFEEDLHKMLEVYFDYMRSWIQMLQQLPQASHSLKNLLEEEWNFTKVITPYIRGGEAQSGKLFCDIAGMLLKSTGDFLDAGLQKSGNEFWECADDSTASDEIRRSVIETSRSLKELFHEARERASKALGFAKMLRKDLEIAAEFRLTTGVPSLLQALKAKNYVKVQIPGLEELQVFVPCDLMEQRLVILQLLNAAAGKDCSKEPDEIPEDEAYLLMSKHGVGDSTTDGAWTEWDGTVLKLVPQMETVDTLRAMKVDNLLLVVMQSAHLVTQRKAFQQSMEELLTLSREQTSSQLLIVSALEQLKNEALQLCIKINTAIDRVDYMFTSEFEAEVEETEKATLQQYYREAMIQGYNFAFESTLLPHRVSSVHENDRLSSVAAELQFKSLSRHSSPTEDREEPSYPKADPSSTARRSWELRNFISQSKDTAARQSPMEAVWRSIRIFDDKHYVLMRQRNIIGQVCNTPKSYDNVMHVGLRKVTFKWQRGNKIGEGQYGKVYTCINVDTGELMAMKEIRFQPNDHKTIKETADELKIFEGIKHPNLVRYFGVELHREEMYIFMEYCDEGTLEEVSRLGLQEHVIRLYSKQITTAINVLHEHGIVHRDIKGANIFLTSSGLIKLGDFGCSVKLKNNAQTMPGEVNSTLGTAAYMAPEVITRAKGEGHGRAADIWSLGCVLIEMVTGKRPWHEYEHNFQIMYKVGMGHKPPIPEKLSTEGKDFLAHCLQSEPKRRWTASALLDHPFVKVCTDEE
ncbi:mitogen-activated protein kinase kinase kinase 4-like [Sinocyclocheilus grahami]|uniref:mitogen-activated protein kinase kinase kinase 4-like n=1 Tax=Sinocyclocheilus grahami TaxID=75366 RepID=UPI0007ACC77F|nr:PREDICTED: mitogen-activated protein kinase kinase kinase 4-like [Sinocyclocheilus grahami]